MPVRQDIQVIPADKPEQLRIGWVVYEEIGLARTSTGDRLGWNTDTGLLDLNFSSQLSEEGKPCLVIDFKVMPKYDFDKFF